VLHKQLSLIPPCNYDENRPSKEKFRLENIELRLWDIWIEKMHMEGIDVRSENANERRREVQCGLDARVLEWPWY